MMLLAHPLAAVHLFFPVRSLSDLYSDCPGESQPTALKHCQCEHEYVPVGLAQLDRPLLPCEQHLLDLCLGHALIGPLSAVPGARLDLRVLEAVTLPPWPRACWEMVMGWDWVALPLWS